MNTALNAGMHAGTFVEVGHFQIPKHGQGAAGDAFLSRKSESDGRIISVLSDGLGSGIKAGVLSTLTATMAMKFVASDMPVKRAAKIIMDTLPVCSERGISYATFTLVDVEPNSRVRIMEYDNPAYVLVRGGMAIEPIKQNSKIIRKKSKASPSREALLWYSDYLAEAGDRLVFFSDGVTQSGMGTKLHPMGWGSRATQEFILQSIEEDPQISARELARKVALASQANDAYRTMDDITCGVIYFRKPRDLLVLTGPPVNPERDAQMARDFASFDGKKIACGGTTANILARELGKKVKLELRHADPIVPPFSVMEGADLVTEGIITLGTVAEILERGTVPGSGLTSGLADSLAYGETNRKPNAATKIIDLLLDSDRITFIVGTKINEAHQDPNMPVELEIRRNVVKKIQAILSRDYLKEATIKYI
jgi:hypothetical protein